MHLKYRRRILNQLLLFGGLIHICQHRLISRLKELINTGYEVSYIERTGNNGFDKQGFYSDSHYSCVKLLNFKWGQNETISRA